MTKEELELKLKELEAEKHRLEQQEKEQWAVKQQALMETELLGKVFTNRTTRTGGQKEAKRCIELVYFTEVYYKKDSHAPYTYNYQRIYAYYENTRSYVSVDPPIPGVPYSTRDFVDTTKGLKESKITVEQFKEIQAKALKIVEFFVADHWDVADKTQNWVTNGEDHINTLKTKSMEYMDIPTIQLTEEEDYKVRGSAFNVAPGKLLLTQGSLRYIESLLADERRRRLIFNRPEDPTLTILKDKAKAALKTVPTIKI